MHVLHEAQPDRGPDTVPAAPAAPEIHVVRPWHISRVQRMAREQQALREAADRIAAGVPIDHIEPPRRSSLGALQALQAEQRGEYDAPRRRVWWGPSDIGARQADELARAQTQYDADVQEGVDGAFKQLAYGAAVVAAALLLLHLALTYWPPTHP